MWTGNGRASVFFVKDPHEHTAQAVLSLLQEAEACQAYLSPPHQLQDGAGSGLVGVSERASERAFPMMRTRSSRKPPAVYTWRTLQAGVRARVRVRDWLGTQGHTPHGVQREGGGRRRAWAEGREYMWVVGDGLMIRKLEQPSSQSVGGAFGDNP